ncbi:PREDICTED: complement C4-A [Mandrillus leucophaeus]|nr:PREDICTED: complement C4-A [Mandrillus leucophaeus]
MRLLWGLIWASSFFTLSLQKPRLLLFSPSVVHLGVPLSVGVQLQDVPRGQVVKGSVFLRNPSHNNVPCSPKVDFTLSSDRDFALLSLQVPLKDVKSCGLHQLLRRPEVQLVAQSPWLKDSLSRKTNIQGVNLLFSSRRGHLFLQTDQPIYNPGQRVRYRVFALDQKMRPSTDAITVTVENSHGLRMRKKDVYLPSSIFQDDFVIPDISEPGTWKISARFSDGLESNRSTQFEVKKYVLPNFEVKITPGKPYILTVPGHLDEIQLDIQARYIYRKPVQGVAYVRFGLLDEDGKKTFLRGLESQTKLVNGQSHISLSKAEFQDALGKLNMGMTDLLGLRLYVAAAIIESPGGEMEEAELTSWSFVSSPFSLDLSKTKRHLVPGAPFLLQALVREMSGSPASGIPVKVSATVSSPGSVPEVQNIQQNTDGSGQVSIPIFIPQTISELQLSVSTGSPYPAIARLTVAAPPSGGPGFLSIERPDSRPPRVGDTLNLNLRAVGSGATFSHYYYMILSRGQIVFMNREPKRTVTSVSVFVDHHLAPSFYFVAFYYHGDRPVANSLRVDVQAGACEGKLELSVDGAKEYRNGESMKLHLETDSPALVALGALDTALYAAGSKSHKPLNMGKVFEVMNSYDLGCGPGGGDSALQVFQAAGLAFSDGEQWTFSRKRLGCPKEKTTRKKRNINFQKAINEKLGQYASPTAKRCCQDGVTRLPMRRSCEQRAARVQQPDCREPFLSCCQFAESLRKKNRTRGQVGLQRALEILQEEDLIDEDDIPVRSFFPENWLWRVETVDRFQILTLWLPDSLTTWEIHGLSLSKTKGLCVATPVQLRVFREFHLHLRLPMSVRRFEQLELRPVLYNYLDRNLTVSVHVSPVEGLCLAGGGGLAQQVLVPAGSARPVAFSVVPTAAAAVSLKVVARGSFEFPVGDAVSKVLQIEKEGAIHTEELVYELNPLGEYGTREVCGLKCPASSPCPLLSQVLRIYNVLDMKNTTCQDLQIEVTVKGHVEYTMEANEDYEDYEYDEFPARDDPGVPLQPVTPLQLFEGRRNRRRREAPKVVEEQESRVHYTVCIWRNGKVGLSGMAIADITLLSGFHALRADLEKLTSLSDRYVSHFETEGPHVLLYFDSVSGESVGGRKRWGSLGLRRQNRGTRALTPLCSPERRCSVFYGAPSKSRLLATLCSAEVCQCAEGKCPRQRRALERGLQDEDGYRMKFACYYPRVEYGFQVKVLREDSRAAFRLFETKITQVLHFTKDVKATVNQTRNFLVRASCRLRLEPGREYLIMGLDGATYDLKGHPQYLLDSNSWIEEMPSERQCRSTRLRAACAQLNDFLQEYGTQGCQV